MSVKMVPMDLVTCLTNEFYRVRFPTPSHLLIDGIFFDIYKCCGLKEID